MNKSKLLLAVIIATVIGSFFYFDLGQYLTLEYLKSQQADLDQYYQANKITTIALFAGIYILMAALSLPGAALMTLLAGAIFGLVTGTIIVSFASSIGATLALRMAGQARESHRIRRHGTLSYTSYRAACFGQE